MAKYCTRCGAEVHENAVICMNCGCAIQNCQSNVNSSTHVNNIPDNKTQISIILGTVGIVAAWLFALVGHVTSIIGIVIGIKEYRQTDKISGLTLSIVGEACSILSSIIGAIAMTAIL